MHALPDSPRSLDEPACGTTNRVLVEGRVELDYLPAPWCARVQARDRLSAVRASGLADELSVESWRKLVELAARSAQAPSAMVTVVEADRQVLVSRAGLVRDAKRTTPLTHSLCRFVVERDAPLVVGDTHTVPGLRDEPAVTELGVAAYAGFPIRTPDGHVIGTLCVTDTRARTWGLAVEAVLVELAAAAEEEVAARLRHGTEDRAGVHVERSWTPSGLMFLVVRANGVLTGRALAAGVNRLDAAAASPERLSMEVGHAV